MNPKRRLMVVGIALLALPLLACNPAVLEVWGDLLATARAVWDSLWTEPDPDYEAVGILSAPELLDLFGEPPVPYVDSIIRTVRRIANAWGLASPYSTAFTIGDPYPKPDGSGRMMVPLQFPNPGGAYGVPPGGPVTGLCLEFEDALADDGGNPVLLLAPEFQVGDWVLPTTTPQSGYAECPSGITPTPAATETPVPAPGDGYEPDQPDPPYHSSIAVGESQGRSLDPYGDEEVVYLWVWTGLHLEVLTHSLGGLASTNLEVPTCSGTFYDTDGGPARVEWVSACDELVVMRIPSSNGYYGPGETYTLQVNQLP